MSTISPLWHIGDSWMLSGSYNADENGLIAARGLLPLINQLHSTQGWNRAATSRVTPSVPHRYSAANCMSIYLSCCASDTGILAKM